MENITFNMANLHVYGSAFYDFLALRKRFFVDTLGWEIPHDDTVEMDQYDNPNAFYSLAVDNGRVMGGVRLMPTNTVWGKHSYMLRDAVRDRIDGIPMDIMESEIVTPQVWEMTRLVISPDLRTQQSRSACLGAIGEGLQFIADVTDCQEFMGLTAPTVSRALRQLGYVAENVGETYRCADDGRKYGIMRIPVMQSAHAIAAE